MPERVWDRFLTEQDQAHLVMSAHLRVGFGRRPALLLIDLYRWVFGDRPEPLLEAIRTWPGSCGLAGVAGDTAYPNVAENRQGYQHPHRAPDGSGP